MNSIGFKNFRKFQDFPAIDLGNITILVGGNNAGKSTLVKAMLLMRDFLKSRIERVEDTKNIFKTLTRPQFNFDTEHVNVGDFYRAFCRQSPRKEDTISFTMKIDKFRFTVNIRGERKPGVVPEVTMIAVSDEDRDVTFTFDFSKNQMTAHFEYDRKALNDHVINNSKSLQNKKETLHARLHDFEKQLSNSKDLGQITAIKAEIEKARLELREIESKLYRYDQDLYNSADYTISEYDSATIDMSFFMGDNTGKLIVPELIKGFANYAEIGMTGDKRSKSYREEEANKAFLRGKSEVIQAIADEIEMILNKQVIEYIYAHSVYQDSVYSKCANSSDYTKRTIHEFYNSRISSGDKELSIPKDEEFELLETWLKEFKIGESLKVIPYKGDNYSLVIFDKANPEIVSDKRKGYPGGIDLADKGMGSIQIVVLLLRIVTLIRKYKGQQLTILLEEPEQNLHPAMQSKLAELLYCLNKDFGVRFVVETHSEYLIRKTQVIVAGLNKSTDYMEIPFRVIYLPDNGDNPYDMQYRPDGKFNREFGSGFFDEAANLAFKIF